MYSSINLLLNSNKYVHLGHTVKDILIPGRSEGGA